MAVLKESDMEETVQVERIKQLVTMIMDALVEFNATPTEGMTALSMVLTSSAAMFGVDKQTTMSAISNTYDQMSKAGFRENLQ
jgi:hypothetical protein